MPISKSEPAMMHELQPKFTIAQMQRSPLPFYQDDFEIPSKATSYYRDDTFKLSKLSLEEAWSRNPSIAFHYLNLPTREQWIDIFIKYRALKNACDTYDREHADSWFQANPEYAIFDPDKDEEWLSSTLALNDRAAVLKSHSDILCCRLAHYYHYHEVYSSFTAAALMNLMTVSRLNGSENTKELATRVRWSWIQSNARGFELLNVRKGICDWLIAHANIAIGYGALGNSIVSLPLFITDFYGNRGRFSEPISNLFTVKRSEEGASGREIIPALKQDLDGDPTGYDHLQAKMYKTIARYMSETSKVDGEYAEYDPNDVLSDQYQMCTSEIHAGLSMPNPENGSIDDWNVGNEVTGSQVQCSVPLNWGANKFAFVAEHEGISADDNITGRLWNNFTYLLDLTQQLFPDMAREGAGKRELSIQLGWTEPAMAVDKMWNARGSIPNIDILDLSKHMVYKKDNQPNTATIVKWAPMLTSLAGRCGKDLASNREFARIHNVDVRCVMKYADTEDTFGRFDMTGDDITDIIKQAKGWPHMNPTFITHLLEDGVDDTARPVVLNTISMPGHDLDSISDAPVLTPVGKGASFLDYASNAVVSSENHGATAFGIAKDEFAAFMDNTKDGFIFTEDPSQLSVIEQPIIDTTDPFQCGFHLLVSYNDKKISDLASMFVDTNNYNTALGNLPFAAVADSDDPEAVGYVQPEYGSLNSGDNKVAVRAHIANKMYLDKLKHALVFVGAGIFYPNFQTIAVKTAGLPYAEIRFPAKDDNVTYALRMMGETAWGDIYRNNCRNLEKGDAFNALRQTHFALTTMTKYFSNPDIDPTEDFEVREFTFDPAYGPISPICEAVGYAGMGSISPSLLDLPPMSYAEIEPHIAAVSRIGNQYGSGSLDEDSDANAFERESLDSVEESVTWWIWFLDTIRFSKVTPLSFSRFRYNTKPVYDMVYTTVAKWWITYLAQANLMFMGIQDTVPLISEKVLKYRHDDIQCAKTYNMVPGNIFIPPRAPRVAIKSSPKTQPGFTPKMSPNKTESALIGSVIEGMTSVRDAGIGSSNNGGSSPKKKSRHANRRKAVMTDEKSGTEEGKYGDASNRSEDKAASKAESIPPTAAGNVTAML